MKAHRIIQLAGGMAALLVLGACGTTPAPPVTITCSQVPALASAGGTGTFTIVQNFLVSDPGISGATALNNADMTIYSDSTQAQLCSLSNTDATGVCTSPQSKLTITTDANGIGRYTVNLVSTGATRTGNLIETFGQSVSVCTVAYSVT